MPTERSERTDIASLDAALDKTLHVKDVVIEVASELGTVNEAMRQQLDRSPTATDLDRSLAQCETIEEKVQVCAEELTQVNEALTAEIDERDVLEGELARSRAREQQARMAALHDPLTGLPNRTLFDDRIALGLAQAKRHDRLLAVMFIDLDDFKRVNDTYGHEAGDRLLQHVARRLRDMTRVGDTVSRHGGDEFVYLSLDLRRTDDVVAIARKIVAAIGTPWAVDDDVTLCVEASIGVACYPDDGLTAATLLDRADTAMYRAKRSAERIALASAAGCEVADRSAVAQ